MRDPTTFIKVDRNILNWRWFQDSNTLHVFLYLLLRANLEDRDVKNYTVHRGEIETSISRICEDTGISARSVRTALQHLEQTGEIHKKSTKLTMTSIYFIEGFDRYQGQPTKDRQSTDKEVTKSRQSTDTPYKNNKNNKNEKNDKKGSAHAREAPEPEEKFNPFKFLDQIIAEEEAKEKAKHEQAGDNTSDPASVGALSDNAGENVG